MPPTFILEWERGRGGAILWLIPRGVFVGEMLDAQIGELRRRRPLGQGWPNRMLADVGEPVCIASDDMFHRKM